MPTFSGSSLIPNNIKASISQKPELMSTLDMINSYGSMNLVGYNPTADLTSNTEEKTFSPSLLNWVGPYVINDKTKTLFYTEINSGFKVGDRVFIINGNYDSTKLIKSDKYKGQRDGYKVLYVDRCGLVLDIDYTGILPKNIVNENDYVNIYYIRNESDFKHANRQITTKGGIFDYKFNPNNGNIIFADKDYNPISGWGQNLGLTGSPGFYQKNGTFSWTNVTSQITSGNLQFAVGVGSTPKGIKIKNYSFTFSNIKFKEDSIYNWSVISDMDGIPGTFSTWIVEETTDPVIITKGNFRNGDFFGTWNTGVFGQSEKQITWSGQQSKWNGGTLLNAKWQSGIFDSKFNLTTSYKAEFDVDGNPYQKITEANNDGRGWNSIISSEILNSTITNGSVYDTILGTTPTYSLIENYLKSSQTSYANLVKNGLFERCRFFGGSVTGIELKNSRAVNTYFEGIKSVNSNYKLSIIKSSNYTSDDIIKILDYDEFNFNLTLSPGNASHKVYKFYISKSSYDRLKLRDRFYIKDLKINNNSKLPLQFFDKRWRFSTWTEYIDDISATYSFYKRGIEVAAFLSTPEDNLFKYNNFQGGGNFILERNSKSNYSVDIVVTTYDKNSIPLTGLNFNYGASATTIAQSQTLKFKYNESGIDYEEILTPSGNYAGRPYYVLTNGTGLTSSFVFFTASNSRWEHWQNFIPGNGTTSGIFYCSLTFSGSTIPVTSVNNWIPQSGQKMITSSLPFIPPGSTPIFLGNTVDISRAWILDSDFESGLFEKSNWNSGNHISYNNDVVMTSDGSVGKYYAISVVTQSQSLVIDTQYDNNYKETGEDCLAVGNIVWLNSVDWDTAGRIDSFTISSSGSGYTTGFGLTSTGGSGRGLKVDIIDNSGALGSVSISFGGWGYSVGDTVTLSGGSGGQIQVLSITGSKVRLPDSYIITGNNSAGILTLQEIWSTQSVIASLDPGGLALTTGAQNRWGYIYKSKFSQSRIKSGIFRRAYIKQSLIENLEYSESDLEFNDMQKIRSLLISDSIFSSSENVLSKATYMNSSFVGGNDTQIGGIIYNSIWNGGIFSNGVFKTGRWVSGTFKNGTFYNSRSFNATASVNYPRPDVEREKSYWKDGLTGLTLSNDRFTWQSGNFRGGEFVNSDWESGVLESGKFYSSKFYKGTINGGILGQDRIPSGDTNIYSANINYTTVENATLVAKDTNFTNTTPRTINWYDGVFNSGVFGTDETLAGNSAIWWNGSFNNGQFISKAIWKNGTFNGGKFISGFGWTMSNSTNAGDYTWQSGVFRGGDFGNANFATNSTWFSGEFTGGNFRGRVWNSGLFTGGNFFGSGLTATGGLSSSNANQFTLSFTQSYWGLWRNGVVSDVKEQFMTDKKIFTPSVSSKEYKAATPLHKIENILWQSGTFSHPNAEISNSVWLDGSFQRGTMINSSFNPYVTRIGNTTQTFNLNDQTCYWENGIFDGGDFYMSEFKNGKFVIGTAYGMIFKDGVSNYMNAYNVFWENGLWKNGNWYGSYFTYDGSVSDDFTLQIIYRGMSWSATSSCHLWNIFQDTSDNDSKISASTNSTVNISSFINIGMGAVGLYDLNSSAAAVANIQLSDINLKENISNIGRSEWGINIYRFNYKGESDIYEGVVAQELLQTEWSHAVVVIDGILGVDYSKIDVEFKKINI